MLLAPQRRPSAREHAERAIELDGQNPDVMHTYGVTLEMLGDEAGARSWYGRALERYDVLIAEFEKRSRAGERYGPHIRDKFAKIAEVMRGNRAQAKTSLDRLDESR